jgi:hypothetical protein
MQPGQTNRFGEGFLKRQGWEHPPGFLSGRANHPCCMAFKSSASKSGNHTPAHLGLQLTKSGQAVGPSYINNLPIDKIRRQSKLVGVRISCSVVKAPSPNCFIRNIFRLSFHTASTQFRGRSERAIHGIMFALKYTFSAFYMFCPIAF